MAAMVDGGQGAGGALGAAGSRHFFGLPDSSLRSISPFFIARFVSAFTSARSAGGGDPAAGGGSLFLSLIHI